MSAKTSALGPANPKKWGPGLWNYMYTMAATFDPAEDNPRAMQQFYVGLKDVLPCLRCRSGYAAVIARSPFPLRATTPYEMLRWMHSVHTQVQQHANLPMHETFEQLATRYAVKIPRSEAAPIVRATGGLRVDGPISNSPRPAAREARVAKPVRPPVVRVAAAAPGRSVPRPKPAPAPVPGRRMPLARGSTVASSATPRATLAAARPRRSGCRRCGGG